MIALTEQSETNEPDQNEDQDTTTTETAVTRTALDMFEQVIEHRGWLIRDGQRKMVEVIQSSLDSDETVTDNAVSAPVGTGKTFGYSIPAISSGRKTLIATSTKALQDQVIGTDLPRLKKDVKDIYNEDFTFSVLKGKSNYACLERVQAFIDGTLPDDDEDDLLFADIANDLDESYFEILRKIADRCNQGMKERDATLLECGDLLEMLPYNVRRRVASTKKCTGCRQRWWRYADDEDEDFGVIEMINTGDLPSREAIPLDEIIETATCPQRMAYALALKADILVINTSLLIAEMMKSTKGGSMIGEFTPQLLPGAGLVVIDEAHHLESILTSAMSVEVNSVSLIEDVKPQLAKFTKYDETFAPIETDIVENLGNVFGQITDLAEKRNTAKKRRLISDLLMEGFKHVSNNMDRMESLVERSEYDAQDEKANKRLNRAFNMVKDSAYEMLVAATQISETKYDPELESNELVYDVRTVLNGDEDDEDVSVHITPLDLSFFRNSMKDAMMQDNKYYDASEMKFTGMSTHSSVVLCSGTITRETAEMVGMDYQKFLKVDSPFDHKRSRLFVPDDLPNPNAPDYMSKAWEYARSVIEASQGRTLFVTTSYLALTGRNDKYGQVTGFVDMCLEEFGNKYKVLYQGNGMSRSDLITEFREDEHSILLGTSSFWEGVDVPGDALTQVILHKAPFPMRDNPQVEARRKWVSKHGENSFIKVDVNLAAIQIGQGAGRLIRAESDRGGIVFLDSRYWDKIDTYGDKLLGLVPGEIPVTSDQDAYIEWLKWINDSTSDDDLPNISLDRWRPLRKTVRRKARKRRIPSS